MLGRICAIAFTAACLWAGGGSAVLAQDPDEEPGLGMVEEDPVMLRSLPVTPTFRAFLPERVDMAADFPPPGDQGRTQTCVGWSTGYALRSFLEKRRRNVELSDPGNRFSPYFVYTQVAENCQSGARISDALTVQGQVGALPIREYTAMNCNQPPAPQDKARAVDYRIGGFRRVDPERPDDVKGELARGRPVVFGMLLNREFMKLRGDDVYDVPPEKAKGGHAMVLIGYDDSRQAYRVINSWGPKWGDRGYGWISYRAFAAGTHSAFTVDGEPGAAPAPPRPGPSAAVTPRPPPAPAPTPTPQAPRQDRPRLAEVARTLDCAKLQQNQNGAVFGFVGSDDDHKRLVATGADVANVAVRPWPQCEAMLTLDRSLAVQDGMSAAVLAPPQKCPRGTLCDGDRMIVEVRMPKTNAAHLYMAYVTSTGDMQMLEQPARVAPTPRRPGAVITLGQGAGQPEYRVSAPFGREMLIVLASASPLFDQELADQMTEREFLTVLRKALIYKPRASDPDRVVSAIVLPIVTAAR